MLVHDLSFNADNSWVMSRRFSSKCWVCVSDSHLAAHHCQDPRCAGHKVKVKQSLINLRNEDKDELQVTMQYEPTIYSFINEHDISSIYVSNPLHMQLVYRCCT